MPSVQNWSSCLFSPADQSGQSSRVHGFQQVKCPRACSASVVSFECRALNITTVSSCAMSSSFSLTSDQIVAMLLIVAMLIDASSKLLSQGSGAEMSCLSHSCHVCFWESFGTGDMSMVKEEMVLFATDS